MTGQSPIDVVDHHLTTYLDLLDLYLRLYASLELDLKKAFFDLAKAKLALGPHRLGPNHYDLTSRAPLKRIQGPNNTNDCLDGPKLEKEGPFLLSNGLPQPLSIISPKSKVHTTSTQAFGFGSGNNTLRKRNHPASSDPPSSVPVAAPNPESTNLSQETRSASAVDCSSPELPDPIHQFAALPPPSLRAAQAAFSNALENAVRLVNCRAQILELERTIEHHKKLINLASNSGNLEDVNST